MVAVRGLCTVVDIGMCAHATIRAKIQTKVKDKALVKMAKKVKYKHLLPQHKHRARAKLPTRPQVQPSRPPPMRARLERPSYSVARP